MVVMEHLAETVSWDSAMRKPSDELGQAVQGFHAAGYVHGDLRECNVLVRQGQEQGQDQVWLSSLRAAKNCCLFCVKHKHAVH